MIVRTVLLACLWIVFIGALNLLATWPVMDLWNGLTTGGAVSYWHTYWLIMVGTAVWTLPRVIARGLRI